MTGTNDPRTIARFATMRRIRTTDAARRRLTDRRQRAARAGYRGPLTRAELAARAAK